MPNKRIRLTIEWDGAAGEMVWADILKRTIERSDVSRFTTVTGVEILTDYGDTPIRRLTHRESKRSRESMIWHRNRPRWMD